jgi:hypothetical protein
MSKITTNIPALDNGTAGTVYNRAEKRRLALQRLFDTIPEQIDAIREKRENDAIELRRFMMQRERNGKRPVIKYSELKWIGNSSERVS